MKENELELLLKRSADNQLEAVILPENLNYFPEKKHVKRKNIFIALATIIIALSLFTGAAAAGYINVYIPGIGYNDSISHSIYVPIVIEKDGYTHKIINCYVINERVYLDIILYETSRGLKLNNNFKVNLGEESNLPSCYMIYQDGIKYEEYTTGYSNTINISTNIKVKKDKIINLQLYSGGEFLTDLNLNPVSSDNEALKDYPNCNKNNISLSANYTRNGNELEVFVGTTLPKDAVLDAFVWFSKNGYYLDQIYLKDNYGNIYRSKSDLNYYPAEGNGHAEVGLLYHLYYFDVPQDVKELTIVIEKVSYFSRKYTLFDYKDELVCKEGPWEIKIMLD